MHVTDERIDIFVKDLYPEKDSFLIVYTEEGIFIYINELQLANAQQSITEEGIII